MGKRRRYKRQTLCESGCAHDGRCMEAVEGSGQVVEVCGCGGAWGGYSCAHYLGHDHHCTTVDCKLPALCVWRPTGNREEPGTPQCVCPTGLTCALGASSAGEEGGPGAWGAGLLALLTLLAALLAVMWLVHRRKRNAFVHARLSDNVEINNPMYLAGEDEPEARQNGGNHFANPVYESMYAAQQNNPVEEHATLLEEGGAGEAPPERAALL